MLRHRDGRGIRGLRGWVRGNVGVNDTLNKMMEMGEEGYEARQIGLKLIVLRTGKQVSAKTSKLSALGEATQQLRILFLRRKAQSKVEAPGDAKAKARASLENSV